MDYTIDLQNGGVKYISPTDPSFPSFITKYYKQFKIGKKKPTFDDFCFPKKFELQVQQKFLSEYINPKTPYDSILAVHRIGAGKTCTMIRICEAWKLKRKIVCLVPASLKGNIYNELLSLCTEEAYISAADRHLLHTLPHESKKYNDILTFAKNEIKEHYEIYSYNKFVSLYLQKKISLDNKLLAVDEIQNMVSDEGLFYDVLYKSIKSAKNIKIVLLSATPIFDKPSEIALTCNLLNLKEPLPVGREFYKMFVQKIKQKNGEIVYKAINLDKFKRMLRGKISYYSGAPSYVYPKLNLHYTECKMEDFQYRAYMTVSTKEFGQRKLPKGTIQDLPTNFLLGTRIISNIAFPNSSISEKGYESLKDKYIQDLEILKKYSIKFYKIIMRIKKSDGPVFVFSNFKEYGGIKSFVKVLEAQGYSNYVEFGTGKKRYAVWSGDVKASLRESIRHVYNKKENSNGSLIKIILGSPSMKEGVSLFRVKQVHIMEPYWNQARMQQIIGRAFRFCSHKDLEEQERFVNVYIYIAVHPNIEQSVDQHILKLSLRKAKLIQEFEKALKECSVDCALFKNANDEDYTCDV